MISKRHKSLGIILVIVVATSVTTLLGYRLWTNREDPDRLMDTKTNESIITERYEGSGLKSHEKAEPGIYQQGSLKYTEEKGFVSEEIYTSWEELEEQGVVTINDGVLYTVLDDEEGNYMTMEHITGAVVLPDHITTVAEKTFWGCDIKELIVPEGVENIGRYAFADCPQLTHISLPESLKNIDVGAFSKSRVNSLVVPEGVKKIGLDAFFEIPHIEYKGTVIYKKRDKYWGAEAMN